MSVHTQYTYTFYVYTYIFVYLYIIIINNIIYAWKFMICLSKKLIFGRHCWKEENDIPCKKISALCHRLEFQHFASEEQPRSELLKTADNARGGKLSWNDNAFHALKKMWKRYYSDLISFVKYKKRNKKPHIAAGDVKK